MYKKQMRFQKIACYLLLVAGVLVFVYSLCMVTDLYDSLYSMMPEPTDPSLDRVAGARIFYDIQEFNRHLTAASIVLILLAVFNFVMNTHSRRRYYIGNYVSIACSVVANIAVTIWSVAQIAAYKVQYVTGVDFETLKKQAERRKVYYTDSTFYFDISNVVFAIVIIAVICIVANLIWKILVTSSEKKLIEEGKGAV